MQWTSLNDVREQFLSFFESKDHLRMPSAPLVPIDDTSLLLINSGMAPLKKYFQGIQTPPRKRVTSCQKCIRTPDIENVGKTSRHGTYFEMLGNFSFGDYFKVEATAWAWEFITQVIQLPVDKLWVSIYLDDDEAFDIWTKQVGVAPERIVRLGKEDNFWEIGAGPCGPCSEIYFDRGAENGCGSPECAVGCDCDRFVEFWNLVFTQFDSDGNGNYTPLEFPNIDTGMGLERLACILQGVGNLFEVDTVQNIMKHISDIARVPYHESEKTDVSLRVITDHIRSTVFMIGDGVVPQNEGRGYVLRRLLRRAARHGMLLGIKEPFLYRVCETVIRENQSVYPDLVENADYIQKVVRIEEERFSKTIEQGMELLSQEMDRLLSENITTLPGASAFRLYDTFGFPLDLVSEIAQEKGIAVDEEEFSRLMQDQRERARAARANLGAVGWEGDVLATLDEIAEEFTGYTEHSGKARIFAIAAAGALADILREGDEGAVLLDKTPFYAESGGQVGDTGTITDGVNIFRVRDTKKSPTGHILHIGVMEKGALRTGVQATAEIDSPRRRAIMRNHSSAHLLQKALREVLGSHIHQAGSMVDEERCRFDFAHFSAMTAEEIRAVEDEVNRMILAALPVGAEHMNMENAKKKGAIALFSEKYGDQVRVISMGDESIELCGGTHVSNTAEIGLFKIISEASVAAGIRRIEATTGLGVLRLLDEANHRLLVTAQNLKAGSVLELEAKSAAVTAELRAKEREIESLTAKLAAGAMGSVLSGAAEIGGVKVAVSRVEAANMDALRALSDTVKASAEPVAAVLYAAIEGKTTVMAAVSKAAIEKGADAGKLLRAVCTPLGGKGGGRADSAQGGVPDIGALAEKGEALAHQAIRELAVK